MAHITAERVYGVQLLDDLHNYFPELLYNSSRFHNVQDVLQYIVANTRRRFDLFSHGSHLYRSSLPPMPMYQPTVRSATPPSSLSSIIESILGTGPTTTSVSLPVPISVQPTVEDNTSTLLLSLLSSSPLTYSRTFLDPVPVIPTTHQIRTASTVSVVDVSHGNDVCSICQDSISIGNRIRTLNACNHAFHISCIDTWFTHNVRCPVCRHDVREPASQQENIEIVREDDAGEGAEFDDL